MLVQENPMDKKYDKVTMLFHNNGNTDTIIKIKKDGTRFILMFDENGNWIP